MKQQEEKKGFYLWVNWSSRVISFSEMGGFEKLQFHTHGEKLKFAMERTEEGFGVR